MHFTTSHTAKPHLAKAHRALERGAIFRTCKGYRTGKVSGRYFITLAGGNRQRGALNTELTKPLIVTAIDRAGLPLANIPLTFEVLRGTGSINPAATSSTTNTTGTGSGTVTTTIPNALTGNNQPATKPNGVNAARRLLITTDANGRAAVWFTLGRQSGEAGNMVQVSASDTNSANATNAANPSPSPSIPLPQGEGGLNAITEAVVFTATGERGVPAKILAEGGGAQYAETGGQPLDPLTAVTYDGEINPVPGAVIAYVIEQDGGVDLDDGARFNASSGSGNSAGNSANAQAISANGKVLITSADNNGRSAARPTMGFAPGTVRISTYAMPANTAVTTALMTGLQDGSAFTGAANQSTASAGLVGLATFQIAVLQQSDAPTQFTGKVLDHTGKPLQGVRVTISRTPLSVTTDINGDFTFLQDVPAGKLDLFVDGRAVTGTTPLLGSNQSSPTQYPSLHFEVLAIRGQKNILSHPMYLPPLSMSQAKIVGGSEDVVLTIPGREGFEMIVKANSVTFPDGSRIGLLVVSPVAEDRLPMVPPGGAATFMRGAAATLQPSGTRFDPPIEIRLANTEGYKPGDRVPIYHWDHDLAQFVPIGQTTVTEDGAQLITDPGSGITKAGWHGGTPPPPPCPDTASGKCKFCFKQMSRSNGACAVGSCELDIGQKDDEQKIGVFRVGQPDAAAFEGSTSVLGRLGITANIQAKLNGGVDAVNKCCEESKRARPVLQANVALESRFEFEGPIPVPYLGLGTTFYIPFTGSVFIGVKGKIYGQLDGELQGTYEACTKKCKLNGVLSGRIGAEVGPRIEWRDTSPLLSDFDSTLSAVAFVEGGRNVTFFGSDAGQGMDFINYGVKAEWQTKTRKYQIFNFSGTKQYERRVPGSSAWWAIAQGAGVTVECGN